MLNSCFFAGILELESHMVNNVESVLEDLHVIFSLHLVTHEQIWGKDGRNGLLNIEMEGALIVGLVLFQSLRLVFVLRIGTSPLEVGVVILKVWVRMLLIVSDDLLHVIMWPLSRNLERLVLLGSVHCEGRVRGGVSSSLLSLGLLSLGLGLALLCLGWRRLALEELLVIICKCGRFGLICGSDSS
jgi:hypothetical protein